MCISAVYKQIEGWLAGGAYLMNLLACGLTSIKPCPAPLNTPSISFFHSSDIHVQFTLKHDYFSVHVCFDWGYDSHKVGFTEGDLIPADD